jgi:hypothetical protein
MIEGVLGFVGHFRRQEYRLRVAASKFSTPPILVAQALLPARREDTAKSGCATVC